MALVFVLVQEGAPANKGVRFDLIGFLLVATFLGSLEVILDRGLVEDWFESNFIMIFSIVCVLAFVALIPWEAAQKNPTAPLPAVPAAGPG